MKKTLLFIFGLFCLTASAQTEYRFGNGATLKDTVAIVAKATDPTAKVKINATALSPGAVWDIIMPDRNINLGSFDATNIANGTVTNTEFQYLSDVLLPIQQQLDSKMSNSGGSMAGNLGFLGLYRIINLVDPVNPQDGATKAYVDGLTHTDDQTASEVNITDAAGYYTGTDVEAMGQEIGSDLADRPTSLGTGRTNAVQYSDVFGQTLADYNTDGAGGAGDLIIITDASPAEVVTTATIAMDGWKMYDDQTADAATITLSDCDPGETLTVYINRASAPTLAGTGLTFNQLPNTTAFAAATTMMIIFEVAYDGTTIDYYYVER